MAELTEQELAELAQQAKIQALKELHKVEEVFHLEIPQGDKTYQAYFKKSIFNVSCKIFAKVQKNDWAGAVDEWLMNCWLEGDTEIQEDDDLKLSLIPVVNGTIGFLETSFKKK